MSWVPLSGYETDTNPGDVPRLLTPDELNLIATQLPFPPAADRASSELARNGIMKWIVNTLKDLEICPSAVPELIHHIIDQHTKSLIAPGTPIGITAAEAVGATTTQMTLNTFHSSGSAKSASFGIDSMRDLIFARQVPKNESCTIYFKDKSATFDDILAKRSEIVGSVVLDFVTNYSIKPVIQLRKYWWHQSNPFLKVTIPPSMYVMRLQLNLVEMLKHKVNIKRIAEVLESEVSKSVVAVYGPISDGIIDLYPVPGIIMGSLPKSLAKLEQSLAEETFLETIVYPELAKIRVKGIAGIKQLYPIKVPVWSVVLYERKSKPGDIENAILDRTTNLENTWIIYLNPDIMRNKGIDANSVQKLCRIVQIIPLQSITGEVPYIVVAMPPDRFRSSRGEVIVRRDNGQYMRRYSMSSTSLTRVENRWYVEIVKDDITQLDNTNTCIVKIEDNFELTMPCSDLYENDSKMYRPLLGTEIDGFVYETVADTKGITEQKPGDYINGKISEAKRIYNAEIKAQTEAQLATLKPGTEEYRNRARRPVNVPRPELVLASEFMSADTDGSNLKDLFSLPDIDKQRTTCNNMHTICKTLGIEAARTFLIQALQATIASSASYVHPANITFIAEFITSRGEPFGATYIGISRQPGGHLSLATLEQAGKVFTQNALLGKKEDIRGVSASVAVGTRMAIGNGYCDIAQDIEIDGVQTTIINDDLFEILRQVEPEPEIQPGSIDYEGMTTQVLNFDFRGEDQETSTNLIFGRENIPTTNVPIPKPQEQKPVPLNLTPDEPAADQTVIGTPILVDPEYGINRPVPEALVTDPFTTTGLLDTHPNILAPSICSGELDELFIRHTKYIHPEAPVPVQETIVPRRVDMTDLSVLNNLLARGF